MRYLMVIICFTFLVIINLKGQSLNDSLIAYWSFDDSTARDHSGHGYDGTIMNNPRPVPGVFGKGTAFRFQGFGDNSTAGDHILIPRIPFETLGDFTISMWVNEEDLTFWGGEGYIFFGDHDLGWLGIFNHVRMPLTSNDSTLYIQHGVGSDLHGKEPKYAVFNKNNRLNWIHYVMCYQNGTVIFYINGKFIDSAKQSINIIGNEAAIARHWWNTYGTSTRFTGLIDEVKIYNRALSPEEVKLEYEGCHSSSFAIGDFDNADYVQCFGSATKSQKILRLTPSRHRQQGAAWYNKLLPVADGFITEFTFKIDDGNQGTCDPDGSQPGADGLAFVIQNVSPVATGSTDWGLGYHGIPNSLAIEFDTFKNNGGNQACFDPDGNHCAVQSNGILGNTSVHQPPALLGITSNIPVIYPYGNIYHVRIDYKVQPGQLRVYIDTTGDFKAPNLVVNNLDLSNLLSLEQGKNAFLGFTASTGDAWETHDILSWSVCSFNKCSDFVPKIQSTTGSFTVCENDSFALNSTENYSGYKWSTGDTSRAIKITKSGTYSLQVIDSKGCVGVNSVDVVVLPKPNPIITVAGNNPLCEGDTTILILNEKFNEYRWNNGATSETIKIVKGGIYEVTVTNEFGCIGSASIEVKYFPKPKPVIVDDGKNNSCVGDSVVLKTKEQYFEYYWFNSDNNILLSRDEKLVIREAGSYYVKVRTKEGCEGISDFYIVDFKLDSNDLSIMSDIGFSIVDFDSVEIGRMPCKRIIIHNRSNGIIKLNTIRLSYNINFSIPQSQLPVILPPNGDIYCTVCFYPKNKGELYDTLWIEDRCSDHYILLHGYGTERIFDSENRCNITVRINQNKLSTQGFYLSEPHPNPTGNLIMMDYTCEINNENSLCKISLFNIIGKKVKEYPFGLTDHGITNTSGKVSGTLQIDVRDLPDGVYLLLFKSDFENKVFTVLIHK